MGLASRTLEGDQLRQMLEERVDEVNRRLGQPDWQPIQLKFNPLTDLELAAAYRDADVALVTPLRDGMNLTGKEFVACRIDPLKPGVLILSPFTGAADVMQEALLVNPYEVGKVADYLHRALTMPIPEAEVRMTALRTREKAEKKEQLLDRARSLMQEAGFKIGMSDGGLVTEAKPSIQWDKGNAAIHILRSAFGVAWSD